MNSMEELENLTKEELKSRIIALDEIANAKIEEHKKINSKLAVAIAIDDVTLGIVKEDIKLHRSDEEIITYNRLKEALSAGIKASINEKNSERYCDLVIRLAKLEYIFNRTDANGEQKKLVGDNEYAAFHEYLLAIIANGMYNRKHVSNEKLETLEAKLFEARQNDKERTHNKITHLKPMFISDKIEYLLLRIPFGKKRVLKEDELQLLTSMFVIAVEKSNNEQESFLMYAELSMESRRHPLESTEHSAKKASEEASAELLSGKKAYAKRFKK